MLRRDWFRCAMGVTGAALVGGAVPARLAGASRVTTPLFALRNPGCGCCEGWADHLRAEAFTVVLEDSPDLNAVKDRMGVPSDLRGCHTGMVEGYIVEGHVPAEFIHRLLDEKPAIRGIAVAGMPAGSPGMESPNPVAYEVMAFGGEDAAEPYVFGRVDPA